MITYDAALAAIHARARPTETVNGALAEVLGLVLADAFDAQVDNPRFDNSSVDGYGVRVADVPGPVRLGARAAAGDAPLAEPLLPGTAVRILTGAPVPPGVEAIAMQEDCRVEGDQITVEVPLTLGESIRPLGEEYRTGDRLLERGTFITPGVLGLLAANGLASVSVHRRPNVAIVATGDELTPVGASLRAGAIYESNSWSLAAAAQALGARTTRAQVGDTEEATRRALGEALEASDLLITSGGVSVGDHDLVKRVLHDLGVREVFWRVAIKPGKPVFFGERDGKLVFGLPGNPVSSLVTFHLFVRLAILGLLGAKTTEVTTLPARLTEPLRADGGRAEFVRGVLGRDESDLTVTPARGRGSHMLGSVAQSDVLIRLPAEARRYGIGDPVEVMPLRWSAW